MPRGYKRGASFDCIKMGVPTNPCKCGWYGDTSGRCRCSPLSVQTYQSCISGPMLDRIDIIIEVPSVHFEDLRNRKSAEPSADIQKRVNKAREIQNNRFGNTGLCNARMGPQELKSYCTLSEESITADETGF